MRKSTAAVAAAAAVAGLVTAAAPAGATGCTPEIRSLNALPSGPAGDGGTVYGFGRGDLAVGTSRGLPVYWKGSAVHAVPLPDGWTNGAVTSVGDSGLMVGTLRRGFDGAAAFSYRPGDAAVRLLTGTAHDVSAAVNEGGRMATSENGVGREWAGGRVVRELPLPADALPNSRVSVSAVNKRGDILGHVSGESYDPVTDETAFRGSPVVWPAGGYPPYALEVWNQGDPTYDVIATGIDNRGRVVGHEWQHWRELSHHRPATWKRPYDALPAEPGRLAGEAELALAGISPGTGAVVGRAVSYEEGWPKSSQPAYWPGTGPVLALPGGSGPRRGAAQAVTDDDRVGGTVLDEHGLGTPTVWTCASKQAYQPQN
ncbi:hypothetical protein [Streptomyces sp. 2P-4]|uniref:hypothetical protein n=1 Tax=Streptomyces sp. 2P-4 TaxID=2931974 RepID=UPI0025425E3A|nr:hypothetical protein [Streptomyces sp. 2P-4]